MTPPAIRASTAKPLFLALNGRRLFALHVTPTVPPIGAIVYLPPFAEEMNRCRSHVATQARALAAHGYHCLILDPYGTGESDGDIVDARWETWRDDADAAIDWLADHARLPVTLWGVRTGALLAAEVAASSAAGRIERLLFWQPVLDGKLFLNQYLRLRIAAQMFNDTEKETTEQLRNRLADGEVLEVAGYPLSGQMADSLATSAMSASTALARIPIAWLEVVSKPGQSVGVPTRKLIDALSQAGGEVELRTVVTPMIWQVHERVLAPELIEGTLDMLISDRRVSA